MVATIVVTLIGVLAGWFIRFGYDRYQENKQIRILTIGLKDEIRRIREDILARKPIEQYDEKAIHGLLKYANGISEDLKGFYETRKGEIGLLNDSDLLYIINKFYENYGIWKGVRQKIIEELKKENGGAKFYPRNFLKESWDLIQLLIKTAEELESKLGKNIKMTNLSRGERIMAKPNAKQWLAFIVSASVFLYLILSDVIWFTLTGHDYHFFYINEPIRPFLLMVWILCIGVFTYRGLSNKIMRWIVFVASAASFLYIILADIHWYKWSQVYFFTIYKQLRPIMLVGWLLFVGTFIYRAFGNKEEDLDKKH